MSDSSITSEPEVVRVDIWELRCKFNKSLYRWQAWAGILTAKVERSGHPEPPLADEPVCTLSQEVSYRNAEGEEVARVHRFLRQDGTIGASGKPDPHTVLYKGVLYRRLKKKDRLPPRTFRSPATKRAYLLSMRIWGPIRCLLLGH